VNAIQAAIPTSLGGHLQVIDFKGIKKLAFRQIAFCLVIAQTFSSWGICLSTKLSTSFSALCASPAQAGETGLLPTISRL